MTLIVLVAGLVLGAAATLLWLRTRPREVASPTERILFPFVGTELSESALDAALRLARAEHATLVPAYLAQIPLALDLEAPQPNVCGDAFAIFEAIEQRAAKVHVPIDSRIGLGRDPRHAMRDLMANERWQRMVVPAATNGNDGFSADEVAWLLRHARGEVLVLRPAAKRLLPYTHVA